MYATFPSRWFIIGGMPRTSRFCLKKISPRRFCSKTGWRGHHLFDDYFSRLVQKEVENLRCGLTWDEAQQEIRDNAMDEKDAEELLRRIQTALPTAIGATHYKAGQLDQAVVAFRRALKSNRWRIKSCGIQTGTVIRDPAGSLA